MSKEHGGRRPNQTGRPRNPDKKVRVGTLFLPPNAVAELAEQALDGETLLEAARRILVTFLSDLPDANPPGALCEHARPQAIHARSDLQSDDPSCARRV
jgi:hypothetical protein